MALALPLCLACHKQGDGSADAQKILEQNRDAMFGLKSLRVDCITTLTYDKPGVAKRYEFATLTAEKPMQMRYDGWEGKAAISKAPAEGAEYTFACDGKSYYTQFGNSYRKEPQDRVNADDMHTILEPWEGFWSQKDSKLEQLQQLPKEIPGSSYEISADGSEDVNGVPCDKVKVHEITSFADQKQEYNETLYIGKDDHLLRRQVQHVDFDGKGGFTRDAYLVNFDLHPSIDPKIYKYVPPPGAKVEDDSPPPPVLANGKKAPDFSAITGSNKKVKLSDFRGKVVVLDFWASWCGPCRESMPHTQEVIKKLQGDGMPVVAFAVDDGEAVDPFKSWVADNKTKYANIEYAHAQNVSSELYKVTGIPTQFILDKHGIVRASFVGYGGPTNDLEFAILAALTK